MNDVFVRLVRFPSLSVRGAVREDVDGNYNVYIDERLSEEQQRQEYMHELKHIHKKHFHRDMPVLLAEKEAKER